MKQIELKERVEPNEQGASRVVSEDQEWDSFLDGRAGVDVQQCAAWARVKAPLHLARRAVVRGSDGQIVAGAQLLGRSFCQGLVRVGYVPFGPVASNSVDALAVVEELEAIGREMGLAALLVQPARSDLGVGEALIAKGYRRSKTDVATSATVELDLTAEIADLRAGYGKSRRKNLKSARKAGVSVRTTGPHLIDEFHQLHIGSAERNGFSPMSRSYLERQCVELGLGHHVEIAIAELDGEPVAAGFFTVYNGRIDFKMTGWNPTKASRAACPNDAIQDAMIEWASDAGLSVFDLGGLPRRHAELLLASGPISESEQAELNGSGTAFKNAWGGDVVLHEPTYERVLRPVGQLTYRVPAALLADSGVGGRIVNWLRRS